MVRDARLRRLLIMRVYSDTILPDLILRSIAKRCVSKDEATDREA
jgi:hypothetical protein